MNEIRHLTAPSAFRTLLRLLWRGSRQPKRPTLPSLRAVLGPLVVDAEALADFRTCLELPDHGSVPITYPHVLAGRLHLAMFADPAFSISMLGAVHTHTRIERHAPIQVGDSLTIASWFDGLAGRERGLVFDLHTQVLRGGEVVWESVNAYQVRGRFDLEAEPAASGLEAPDDAEAEASWSIPHGLGRRYARVCGDWNPIHVSDVTARMFGMKGAIVHGYANLAIALERLADEPALTEVEAAFKGPARLGRTVSGRRDADGRFALFTPDDPRPSVVGAVRSGD